MAEGVTVFSKKTGTQKIASFRIDSGLRLVLGISKMPKNIRFGFGATEPVTSGCFCVDVEEMGIHPTQFKRCEGFA